MRGNSNMPMRVVVMAGSPIGSLRRSAAVSTSCSVRSMATRRPAKFASVSASACSVDQRTAANGRAGRRGDIATSQ